MENLRDDTFVPEGKDGVDLRACPLHQPCRRLWLPSSLQRKGWCSRKGRKKSPGCVCAQGAGADWQLQLPRWSRWSQQAQAHRNITESWTSVWPMADTANPSAMGTLGPHSSSSHPVMTAEWLEQQRAKGFRRYSIWYQIQSLYIEVYTGSFISSKHLWSGPWAVNSPAAGEYLLCHWSLFLVDKLTSAVTETWL